MPLLIIQNNILAVEYLKAASIPCHAVKRIGKGHDTDDKEYSASAIRNELDINRISSIYNCRNGRFIKAADYEF